MDSHQLRKTMKIKKVIAAASFWGQFKFRGDSFLEFEAVCSGQDGWSLEEAKQVHLELAKEVTLGCALDAITRGQISKENFAKIQSSTINTYDKMMSKLNNVEEHLDEETKQES
jgi:hypothetical protein